MIYANPPRLIFRSPIVPLRYFSPLPPTDPYVKYAATFIVGTAMDPFASFDSVGLGGGPSSFHLSLDDAKANVIFPGPGEYYFYCQLGKITLAFASSRDR